MGSNWASSSVYISSIVSFLPLTIFGFITGNVDFLLQGWFKKSLILTIHFFFWFVFAIGAPQAQGGDQ